MDFEKVKLFIQAMEKVCFKGYVSSDYMHLTGISEKENVDLLSSVIYDMFNNGVKGP